MVIMTVEVSARASLFRHEMESIRPILWFYLHVQETRVRLVSYWKALSADDDLV